MYERFAFLSLIFYGLFLCGPPSNVNASQQQTQNVVDDAEIEVRGGYVCGLASHVCIRSPVSQACCRRGDVCLRVYVLGRFDFDVGT